MIICCCLLEAQLRGNPCIQPLHQPAERQLCGEKVRNHRVFPEGFVYVKESDELIEEARHTVDEAIQKCLDRGITDWGKLKNTTKDSLSDYVWKKTKRRPMILPIIQEV